MTTPAFDATLEIERVVGGGDGLARHQSLAVFVPRTLARERVYARVTIKGTLGRGVLRGVERPSPERVAATCAHYDRDHCGGCQLQHASYAEQLRIKSAIVTDAFRRIAHREIAPPVVHAAPSPWRYRRKLTLALRHRGGAWYAGLRRYDAPDAVFALDDCTITDERVLAVWRAILAAGPHLPEARELRGAVRVDDAGRVSVVLEGGGAWPAVSAFFEALPSVTALWWAAATAPRARLVMQRDGQGAAGPLASFAQVNSAVGAAMLDRVLARVRARAPMHVIDAYAGNGDAAAALGRDGIRVTAIELDRDAAAWGASRVSATSRVIEGRVEDHIARALPADVVILNPPRTGVDVRVCAALERAADATRAVVYVSCDPATLARDVARLPAWRIASIECYDMFPQTAHVETVCELLPVTASAA